MKVKFFAWFLLLLATVSGGWAGVVPEEVEPLEQIESEKVEVSEVSPVVEEKPVVVDKEVVEEPVKENIPNFVVIETTVAEEKPVVVEKEVVNEEIPDLVVDETPVVDPAPKPVVPVLVQKPEPIFFHINVVCPLAQGEKVEPEDQEYAIFARNKFDQKIPAKAYLVPGEKKSFLVLAVDHEESLRQQQGQPDIFIVISEFVNWFPNFISQFPGVSNIPFPPVPNPPPGQKPPPQPQPQPQSPTPAEPAPQPAPAPASTEGQNDTPSRPFNDILSDIISGIDKIAQNGPQSKPLSDHHSGPFDVVPSIQIFNAELKRESVAATEPLEDTLRVEKQPEMVVAAGEPENVQDIIKSEDPASFVSDNLFAVE